MREVTRDDAPPGAIGYLADWERSLIWGLLGYIGPQAFARGLRIPEDSFDRLVMGNSAPWGEVMIVRAFCEFVSEMVKDRLSLPFCMEEKP